METEIEKEFIEVLNKQVLSYKSLAEKAIAQIDEPALFIVPNENSNSIAMIMQHLAGNMLSRWTDWKTTDGEKAWRDRDTEFEAIIQTQKELIAFWNKGWDCYLSAMQNLQSSDLMVDVYIRGERHTLMAAAIRQLVHYPYHIGQIIYLCKLLKDKEWDTLSIAKNKSKAFNENRFGGSDSRR
jgi:hypothetical protein